MRNASGGYFLCPPCFLGGRGGGRQREAFYALNMQAVPRVDISGQPVVSFLYFFDMILIGAFHLGKSDPKTRLILK